MTSRLQKVHLAHLREIITYEGLSKTEGSRIIAGAGRFIDVVFDGRIVSWDRTVRSFVAEASDIRWNGEAIRVTNPKTGGSSLYVNPIPKKNREGEVMWWTLTPQGGGNHVLRVFND